MSGSGFLGRMMLFGEELCSEFGTTEVWQRAIFAPFEGEQNLTRAAVRWATQMIHCSKVNRIWQDSCQVDCVSIYNKTCKASQYNVRWLVVNGTDVSTMDFGSSPERLLGTCRYALRTTCRWVIMSRGFILTWDLKAGIYTEL